MTIFLRLLAETDVLSFPRRSVGTIKNCLRRNSEKYMPKHPLALMQYAYAAIYYIALFGPCCARPKHHLSTSAL